MKKLIVLTLCLMMIVSCFVGCGKKSEAVDLVVWTAYAEGTPAYEVAVEKIAEFEELKGVNIEVKHYGTDLSTLLGTALDSGERIDVFPLGSTIDLKANFKHTLNLNPYVEESDILDRAYPIHMELIKLQSENNDEYHSIPTISSYNSFWYNKAAFEAAGVDGISLTPTFEEFEEVCDKLVAAGYRPIALDGAYAPGTFGTMCGRLVGEEAMGDMVFNGGFAENERFVATCQKVIDWVNKGYFDPMAPAEWPASQNKIALTGETVMVSTGMWLPGEVEEMTGESLEWGNFLFPIDPDFEEGTKGASVSCTCNCINVNCENPDLAWEYIYYMCTGEVNKAITDADVYLVDDMTMEPLPRFVEAKEIMAGITENINYAGGMHNNADIKTSINDLALKLYSGGFATGEEAAAAFDALVLG